MNVKGMPLNAEETDVYWAMLLLVMSPFVVYFVSAALRYVQVLTGTAAPGRPYYN